MIRINSGRFKNGNLGWGSLELSTLTSVWRHQVQRLMCEVSSCWGPFLIEFHGRNKNNNPKNNAEQFHIWFPAAPLAWTHTQLYKWREVFTTFPCALRVNVGLMCAGGCQQPGRPLLLITDMSCLNVMLEHRCSIQASAAPPPGRVWRTHAIPHICSISDCITQVLLTFSAITNWSCYHSNPCFTRNAFCMNVVDLFPIPPLRNVKKLKQPHLQM